MLNVLQMALNASVDSRKKLSIPPHLSISGRHKLLFSLGIKLIATCVCMVLSIFMSFDVVTINEIKIMNFIREENPFANNFIFLLQIESV